ncbi:glutathione peroxidase [Flavobacterium sp.]|jgi:glutathione peroxidase|uniref:glutathione peroxidase n=1 Tax=Flavobacterium sp. TaxID=239 RepID=UPI002A80B3F9|nr:glutathione peroxidase [Flavobacterium sp.]
MRNIFRLFAFALTIIGCKQQESLNKNLATSNNETMERATIHQFKVQDLEGKEFDFSTLKGKKIMVVNTASKCGLTPQYKDLQSIYDKYKSDDFVIVGFPANDFMSQEPGTNDEIATFCERNYGVTFPMMNKITVKGKEMNPVYQFLTQKAKNGVADSEVEWNFQKYLLNEEGQLDMIISPKTLPTDVKIINWIEGK